MYGHLGYTYLIKLLKNKVDHGYTITNWDQLECTLCSRANIKQVPMPCICGSELTINFGDHLHVDIWGHTATLALGHYKYAFTIIDDATQWCKMIPITAKSKALEA